MKTFTSKYILQGAQKLWGILTQGALIEKDTQETFTAIQPCLIPVRSKNRRVGVGPRRLMSVVCCTAALSAFAVPPIGDHNSSVSGSVSDSPTHIAVTTSGAVTSSASYHSAISSSISSSTSSSSSSSSSSATSQTTSTTAPSSSSRPKPKSSDRQSVGLVLSGGGAKGIAEIGVIKVLEENNIPIDYITGTSMGAIVGGLYACGYSPEEMMQLILSKDFQSWSSGEIDPQVTFYFSEKEPNSALLSVPFALGDSAHVGKVLPESLISPLPMNFAFMRLFTPYTAQCKGDFNNLFVPFRCVCSDVEAKHKLVMSKGSVGDAIRSSMSFPLVFHPIQINGVWCYDGGIYDNFPFDVMKKDFNPDIMFGVDVSTTTKQDREDMSILAQLDRLIMQGSNYDLPADYGVKLHIDLSEFGLLDWSKAQEIYDIGYNAALGIVDSLKVRITARRDMAQVKKERDAFKKSTPQVRFDSVYTIGGTPEENAYITYLFKPRNKVDTFGLDHARLAYYRAVSSDALENLEPQAILQDDGNFHLELKATPQENYRASVGGFVTTSTNSYIFLSAAYNALRFKAIDANISGWLGQSYMAGMLNLGYTMRRHLPSTFTLQAIASRHKYYQNDYLFFEDKTPTFVLNNEAFARLIWSCAVGSRGIFSASAGYGHLIDQYFPTDDVSSKSSDAMGRDRLIMRLGQAKAEYHFNTLDNQGYPTTGHELKATAMGLFGDYSLKRHFNPNVKNDTKWLQLEVLTRNYWALTKHWGVGVEGDLMLSTEKLLPDYNSSIVHASAYIPTASADNFFNPGFRANSYVAAGFCPYWQPVQNFTVRSSLNLFMPLRKIMENPADFTAYYGEWFHNPEFYGELSASFSLKIATLAAYVNYQSYPAHNWNFGITFGLYMPAPRFLR